ncbi:hypothetical protein BCV69DRAFT_304405 [Microstroma glucosiphilum]|uniref:Uncharacterized protein n=1 Tax=Pseudomicrostroma glucosiphilum TaxID=1684307 RepID=A0A316TZL1_9BASI|nr:hypothetical protein BCV69DRAFT_304405 [Pseudomicrostroma glucosiphilum]PWN18659.1 hypothetical protein BCV69DRAFT_304405 [Pseudomicrostroma glucosiphilum]
MCPRQHTFFRSGKSQEAHNSSSLEIIFGKVLSTCLSGETKATYYYCKGECLTKKEVVGAGEGERRGCKSTTYLKTAHTAERLWPWFHLAWPPEHESKRRAKSSCGALVNSSLRRSILSRTAKSRLQQCVPPPREANTTTTTRYSKLRLQSGTLLGKDAHGALYLPSRTAMPSPNKASRPCGGEIPASRFQSDSCHSSRGLKGGCAVRGPAPAPLNGHEGLDHIFTIGSDPVAQPRRESACAMTCRGTWPWAVPGPASLPLLDLHDALTSYTNLAGSSHPHRCFLHTSGDTAAAMALEEEGAMSSGQQGTFEVSPLASLHKYITLPLALHIPPLPSLHYQAVPTSPSAASSEVSLHDTHDTLEPQNATIGNNLRLQSLVLQPPPLDLDTISFLLDASNAAYAIEPFAQLFQLLDKADADPHFENLIAFFDARYDGKTGVLEGAEVLEDPRDHDHRLRSASGTHRQGVLGRMVSRRTGNASSRKASSAATSARSGRPSTSLGQSGTLLASLRRSGSVAAGSPMSPIEGGNSPVMLMGGEGESVFVDDDGDAFAIASSTGHETYDLAPANTAAATIGPPRYAPHLVVPSRSEPGKARSVAFPVRLDLHNAGKGLCPPPPLPTSPTGGGPREWSQQQPTSPTSPSYAAVDMGSSRSFSRGSRVRSPSQASGLEGGTGSGFTSSLKRIISPDSAISGHSGYSAHSSDPQEDVGGTPLGPRSTHDSAGASSLGGKQQQPPPSRRRTSTISRILSFRKGKKREPSFGGSVFSGGGSSDVGGEDPSLMEEYESEEVPPVPPVPAHLLPPLTIPNGREGQDASQKSKVFSPLEEGMGGLVLSPTSAAQATPTLGTAATTAQLSEDGQPYGSHLLYTTDEGGLRSSSPPEDGGGDEPAFASADGVTWAGAAAAEGGGALKDFLSLFREAAETALKLPAKVEDHPLGSPSTNGNSAENGNGMSDKAKGKQPVPAMTLSPMGTPSSERAAVGHGDSLFPPVASPGASRRSSSHRSRRSVFGDMDSPALKSPGQETLHDLDNGDDEADLFTRARQGKTSNEVEPWWPSGGIDPLPVSILSALGLAFGWKGTLALCYGPGSPVTRGGKGGELGALGRAVAMAAAERRGEAFTDSSNSAADAGKKNDCRTLSDWHRLATSISKWVELYEMTRIRSGLSREIGLDPTPAPGVASEPLATQAQYSLTSGVIPAAVASDASRRSHAFRRRLGIPEGLPANDDGVELGDYRWSRSKLGPASAATSLTLAGASLAHYLGAIDGSDLSYSSAWELDYLEALVLKSPVIAERFPAPIGRAVALPIAEEQDGQYPRGKPCPYPRPDGSFDASEWERWLRGGKLEESQQGGGLKGGDVLTPAVSVQAWWACIAIISSSTGANDATIDLQILGKDEDWRDVACTEEPEDSGAVYI